MHEVNVVDLLELVVIDQDGIEPEAFVVDLVAYYLVAFVDDLVVYYLVDNLVAFGVVGNHPLQLDLDVFVDDKQLVALVLHAHTVEFHFLANITIKLHK